MRLLNVSGNKKYGNFAVVDEDDYSTLSLKPWRWSSAGYVVTGGYWLSKKGNRTVPHLLHRVITNAPDELVVDHKNSNRNDNRKCNLKVCTQSENSKNKFGSVQYDFKLDIADLVVIKAWYNIDISDEMKKYIESEKFLLYRCHKDQCEGFVETFSGLGFTDFHIQRGVYL